MSDSVRPHRRQPARLPHPWDSPGKTLEWVAISFSNAWKWKVKVKSLSRVRFLATPWTGAHHAPPSMGFSRQEYWSGVPLPSPAYQLYLNLKKKKNQTWSVQFSRSVVSNSLWPYEPQHTRPPCPSPTSRSPPKPMSIESVMPSSHLVLCHPLLLPWIFPSIRVFSNESALHIRWPKYRSFSFNISFNISSSKEHPGLISLRMDWLDLLAVHGTLKSLLQHHSSKASILKCSLSLYCNSHIHTGPLEKP